MSTAAKRAPPVDVSTYLATELESSVRHEYVEGFVYAMAGGRVTHSAIATNVLVALGAELRGKPCRPFNSDMKIRIRTPQGTRFYYPDASVVCRSNPPTDTFQDEPVVLIEVLSDDTRRIDEGEKKHAYLTIPSLAVYVLLEQSEPSALVYRRTAQGFERERHSGLTASIPLPEVHASLRLAEAYEGLQLGTD